ncbi:DUF1254 domain-containing protein, partial [Streptomyces sp. JV185]|uniref:DUF1254 domain-containing protein n=1 Tax=Streptomyces sp. JV185 TaxID=858638 RepID=UPI002E7A85F7
MSQAALSHQANGSLLTTNGTPVASSLIGPDWTGDLPQGVRRTATAPTPWVLVVGRTLVEGVDDLPTVHALQ